MEKDLIIKELDKEEFESLVVNIFYYLGYSIDKSNNNKFEYYLEKEELQFILKINFKIKGNYNTLEDVFKFQKEVVNSRSWKGYFITNTDFDQLVYNQLDTFKDDVRLFNHNESLRLGLRSI